MFDCQFYALASNLEQNHERYLLVHVTMDSGAQIIVFLEHCFSSVYFLHLGSDISSYRRITYILLLFT